MFYLMLLLLLLSPPAQADACDVDATTRRAITSYAERIERLQRLMDDFEPDDSAELVYWAFTAEAAMHDTYADAAYPDCLLPLIDAYSAVINDMYALGAMLLWRMDNDNAIAVERMHLAWDARLARAAVHMQHWQQLYEALP